MISKRSLDAAQGQKQSKKYRASSEDRNHYLIVNDLAKQAWSTLVSSGMPCQKGNP